MDYSDFLRDFLSGLRSCLSWIQNMFSYSPILSDYLIFTIMAIAIFIFVVEELLGILTSLRFGGFFIRRFRHWFIRPIGSYDSDYSKSFDNNYDTLKNPHSYRKVRAYVSYGGKVYPVYSSKAIKKYARAGLDVYKSTNGKSFNKFASSGFSGSGGSNYNSSGNGKYSVSDIRGKGLWGMIKFTADTKTARKYIDSLHTAISPNAADLAEAQKQKDLVDSDNDRINSISDSDAPPDSGSSKNIDIVKDDDE